MQKFGSCISRVLIIATWTEMCPQPWSCRALFNKAYEKFSSVRAVVLTKQEEKIHFQEQKVTLFFIIIIIIRGWSFFVWARVSSRAQILNACIIGMRSHKILWSLLKRSRKLFMHIHARAAHVIHVTTPCHTILWARALSKISKNI